MRNVSKIMQLKSYNMLETSLKTLTFKTLLHTRMHALFAYDEGINFLIRYVIPLLHKILLELLLCRRSASFDALLQYSSHVLNRIKI